jgi:hypothetical protein
MCITRMKFSPDNCSIGVRGPMIEALCSRPSRWPNSFDHRRQLIVLMGQGGFQVERDDHRLRMAGGFDLVVDLGQIGFGLAQQQHGGAMGGIGFRGRRADAATGAGDQDDPTLSRSGRAE